MEKKKLTLTSLNKEEYSDKEVECVVVKDMKAYVQYLLENGAKVKYAQKTASVSARVGVVGEEVDTRPRVERDGQVYVIGETKGKVKVEGSMIVKNPMEKSTSLNLINLQVNIVQQAKKAYISQLTDLSSM